MPVGSYKGAAGAWQYPLPDGPSASLRTGLGSLRQWTDASSQVTYAARYAPFGTLLWKQGTAPGPWGFAGEMQDPTGLIYLRARWYDSATGRFLTRDPVPGVPMLPASLNPYVYALNNPVLYTDPSGEFIIPLLLGVAIGGGFAAYNYFQTQPCATFPSALSDPAFQRAVGIGMLTGAVGGLIGFGVGVVGAGAFGGGLAGAIISGAVGGGLAGGGMEALRQVVTYGHVNNPQLIGAAMLSGVASGGVLGAVGYGLRLYINPTGVARSRATALQNALPEGSRGRVTMGVGVVEDASGVGRVVIGTSEPHGYLRPGVSAALKPGEIVVPGLGHAEANIVNWAIQNGQRVIVVAAGRPICPNCVRIIEIAGGIVASPRR